jgi:hypothetical protein
VSIVRAKVRGQRAKARKKGQREEGRSRAMRILRLVYPEWQGYGVNADAHAGTTVLAAGWFNGSDTLHVEVPLSETLAVEGGVLGLSSIAPRYREVLDAIRRRSPDRILMAPLPSALCPNRFLL